MPNINSHDGRIAIAAGVSFPSRENRGAFPGSRSCALRAQSWSFEEGNEDLRDTVNKKGIHNGAET
jgi:hypothetical protein